jgi:peroxiredoxin
MSIQPGERIPEAVLQYIHDGVQKVDTFTLFDGNKTVLFSVPGAFTPTCSERHLPGFVEHYDEFQRRGINVACMAVNDPFVMEAWGESQHVPEGLRMLSDGNGEFTRALGLEMDASAYGMGARSKRFALYIEDGMVKQAFVEAAGEFRVSSAENVLASLD